jgi:hypothetical protein
MLPWQPCCHATTCCVDVTRIPRENPGDMPLSI